jgi:coenzyme F420-reducing hydrogenase delta subunit
MQLVFLWCRRSGGNFSHQIFQQYKNNKSDVLPLLKKMLMQLGIEDERLRLEWCSAAEGNRFASIVDDMTEQIRKLGPFNYNGGDKNG